MGRLPQPHPDVGAADVERIARRDFPADQVAGVLAILGEYGGEDREHDRVRMAVLKLANGNLTQVKHWTAQARMDYRDVLGPAEYPLYGKRWSQMDRLSEEEQARIIQSDWAQYEKWLNAPAKR